MFAVWEYEEDNWRSNSFLKLVKDLNGSDVSWKAIPQMCPSVAEATFQKIGTRLRQNQFVITNPKSIIRAEGLK